MARLPRAGLRVESARMPRTTRQAIAKAAVQEAQAAAFKAKATKGAAAPRNGASAGKQRGADNGLGAQSGSAAQQEPPRTPGLAATLTPGVYINSAGVQCDHRGIALTILELKRKVTEHEVDVLGEEIKTPAQVMKLVALDKRLPLHVRLGAAKDAAPYYDRKMPQAVDGGLDPNNPSGPGLPIGLDLKGLDSKELATMRALLEKSQKAAGGRGPV